MAKKPGKTAEQKAEEKAERDRVKADKKLQAAETKRLAKEEADARKHNEKQMGDADRQQLFIRHANNFQTLELGVRAAIKKREEMEKVAKEDGFTKKQLMAAYKMGDPKRDARLRAEIRTIAQVAVWMGAPMNFQFDMFGNRQAKSEVDVTDQAYAEGQNASATNQTRRVPVHYPAGGEAFNAWLAGFDDHQRHLASGFKALEPKSSFAEKNAATIADGDRIARGEQTSGTPVTRSAFEAAGGIGSIGQRTREIIEGAGGTPAAGPSSSEDLEKRQGIEDDDDED